MLSRSTIVVLIFTLLTTNGVGSEPNWHQAAGPNGNWQTDGDPPLLWSATRNENIRWRTPMPEAGMSNVTIWGERVFVTTHVPIKTLEEKAAVKDILGFCLDANTGEQLWQVSLPGSVFISLAGGFSDGTVFAPIADGEHVWFFNRCGAMGCYDFSGKEVWLRKWTPRFKHNNRQAEPYLVGDTILNVEVANKQAGALMQKWASPGVLAKEIKVSDGIDEKEVWTYIHGIDKRTGEILWREQVGTSIHNTPTVGRDSDGKLAVSHARGGPHSPLEKPFGQSLTSLAPGQEGKTLWSIDLDGYDPSFACHWNEKYSFGFHKGNHIVIDSGSGKLLREQPLYERASLWKFDPGRGDWVHETNVAVKAGKGHPNTNQANLVVGDWHWFLSHNVPYVGRVNVHTGEVEYLELPAQLMPSNQARQQDIRLWGNGNPTNQPLNAAGFAVGDKGHNGTGWGHISAASPTVVGHYLFLPVVTGTVYVIDVHVDQLSPRSLVAVNDLGPGGQTWTLASLTYANERLYAHTMKEILCIQAESKSFTCDSLWSHVQKAADLGESRGLKLEWDGTTPGGAMTLKGMAASPETTSSPRRTGSGYAWAVVPAPKDGWSLGNRATVEARIVNRGTQDADILFWVVADRGWDAVADAAKLAPGESRVFSCLLRDKYPDGTPKIDPTKVKQIQVMLKGHIDESTQLEIQHLASCGVAPPWQRPVNRIDVPIVESVPPTAGKRVRYRLEGDEHSDIYSILNLPEDWKPGEKFPLIVEYPGNIFFTTGCYSTGLPDQCTIGYGITKGKGAICISLPFVDSTLGTVAENAWGNADDTAVYAIRAVNEVCQKFGGDVNNVVLTGFSRGALACGYIGLRNDRIAALWKGFHACQHYDGDGWNGANLDGALQRARRFRGKSVFQTDNSQEKFQPIMDAMNTQSIFAQSELGAHACAMFLDERPSTQRLRRWYWDLVRPDRIPDKP
jgi:outer membrane protein assembly factor BamB